jgi:hypothetical protein
MGVLELVVPDNLKFGVIKAHRFEQLDNPALQPPPAERPFSPALRGKRVTFRPPRKGCCQYSAGPVTWVNRVIALSTCGSHCRPLFRFLGENVGCLCSFDCQ